MSTSTSNASLLVALSAVSLTLPAVWSGAAAFGTLHAGASAALVADTAIAQASGGGSAPRAPGDRNSGWSSKARSAGGSAPRGPATLAPMAPPLVVPPGGVARDNAVSLLRQAIASPSALVRANAIEAVGPAGIGDRTLTAEFVQIGLADLNRGVRFVSAMNVGLLGLCEQAMLVEPLLRDDAASVRASAIFALSRCGRPVDPTPLAAMLLSDDAEARSNAALVLGELGNPTAVPMLRQSLGRGMPMVSPARVRIVELQVAEAQVKLGDARAADPIRAALFSPPEQSEYAALACQVLGRVKDESAVSALERLIGAEGPDERAPEVKLAAAVALAELGRSRPAHTDLAIELTSSERADVRAQAATSLAKLRDPRGLPAVERLLTDSNPQVQVAAAGAVVQLSR